MLGATEVVRTFQGRFSRCTITQKARLMSFSTRWIDMQEAEVLGATEVAKIFEGRLAETLLAEDGQLSLSNLAASTFATLLPKIETQGQLGRARWRLVSAPSIPGESALLLRPELGANLF